MTAADQATEDPAALRNQMIDSIADQGYLSLTSVREALKREPRHRYLPGVPLREAYDPDRAVTTKPNTTGGRQPRSCASKPTVVAMQLEQLDAKPGEHILDVGAGTGWNAGLLAQIVGPSGVVVTIDIHPDVTADARRALDSQDHSNVVVVTTDGRHGHAAHASYDGIIVTVGPWDLPPAWTHQLVDGGRLVVPLRFRGNARSIRFTRDGALLRSSSSRLCGFIPMEGPNQDGEREATANVAGGLTFTWDADQNIDLDAIAADDWVRAGETVWSGAVLRPGESVDGIWLRLAATEHGTCRLTAPASEGIAALALPHGRNPTVVDGNSFSYLTLRNLDPASAGTRRIELGAAACGEHGEAVAARFAEQIRAWDDDRDAQPTIVAYPASTPDDHLPPGQVIDKVSNRLVISY